MKKWLVYELIFSFEKTNYFLTTKMQVDWNKVKGQELFDLLNDDGRNFDFAGYSLNLANQSSFANIVQQLHTTLQQAVETWY